MKNTLVIRFYGAAAWISPLAVVYNRAKGVSKWRIKNCIVLFNLKRKTLINKLICNLFAASEDQRQLNSRLLRPAFARPKFYGQCACEFCNYNFSLSLAARMIIRHYPQTAGAQMTLSLDNQRIQKKIHKIRDTKRNAPPINFTPIICHVFKTTMTYFASLKAIWKRQRTLVAVGAYTLRFCLANAQIVNVLLTKQYERVKETNRQNTAAAGRRPLRRSAQIPTENNNIIHAICNIIIIIIIFAV